MKNTHRGIVLGLLACVLLGAGGCESVCPCRPQWETKLDHELPKLGHRNWIVIADSAYPWQTRDGIKTLVTHADQASVVEAVLRDLARQPHVKPVVYMDAELPHVAEADAPGITAYRQRIADVLHGAEVHSLPHEQIIHQLDEAGAVFHVIILKSNMTLPYTSVFLQLQCGYWNDAAEARLRKAMAGK